MLTAVPLTHAELHRRAQQLQDDGRLEAALELRTEAARSWPASAAAWHNLAGALADLGRPAEAREAVESALRWGREAPESWLTYGNILLAQHDPAAAEAAYRQALARRPAYVDAALKVSQLVWMRCGDWAGAAEPLTQALRAGADPVGMLLTYARLLESDGWTAELAQLHRELESRHPDDARVLRTLAERALLDGELDRALFCAERAVTLSPRFVGARAMLTAVRLGRGEPGEAMIAARAAVEVDPLDQSTWGWLGTAARAAGDPLYDGLCDYGALVGAYHLPTPPGWSSLGAFLSDLQEVLLRRHSLPHAPYDQTVRGGTQTPSDLVLSDDPVLRAFFATVKPLVSDHARRLRSSPEPVRARNTGRARSQSAWSVRLSSGGHHTDHFHPRGWLSSAFYVALPQTSGGDASRAGWLRFGRPPFPTRPIMEAEHFVRPEPGLLVLFPSYLWHGTEPFTSRGHRLTVAFDAVPC